jgi:CheY-like chemotaxis protein
MELVERNRTVMLIDDDPITNMIHTKLLKREHQCEVTSFTQAKHVLELLKSQGNGGELPEVMILDINMPVIDGWAFLIEFEKLPMSVRSKCKIFMVSSSIDRDDEEKSRNYSSVHGFFSKPLTKEAIVNTIFN